jgi:O-acetyl-ADP-ribose deacetylase (regulator of RNase III)
VIYGELQEEDKALLASCYRSCLSLADENGLKSIAFCCISTGEFHFPNRAAAEIAVRTVTDYKRETKSKIKVVFNVFKSIDREIYEELLG